MTDGAILTLQDVEFDEYGPPILHVRFYIGMNNGNVAGTLRIPYKGGDDLKEDLKREVIDYMKRNIALLE